MDSDRDLLTLHKLISKISSYSIKNPDHQDFKEDVVQEAFLKVYDSKFIRDFDLNNEEDLLVISSYVKKTVRSCYYDYLGKLGIIRRLTKEERKNTDLKTQNIQTVDLHSEGDDASIDLQQKDSYSHEQYIMARQTYSAIKLCFDNAIITVKNKFKSEFFESAFWSYNTFDAPLNKLADLLGYESTNPTQEFGRFVEKVNKCTKIHGIKIERVNEQVEFLKQVIHISEART